MSDKPLTDDEIAKTSARFADLGIGLHQWMVRRRADHYEIYPEALEKLLSLAEYATTMVISMADTPCRLDHHGRCQEHDGIDPCPHPRLREMLGL